MFVKTYNQDGAETGKTLLPKDIFGLESNPDLLFQITRAQAANQRQGTAHTKTRGEVSGGGKKPWRQKGTGRARHSSIRSPLWRGGGVVFGPRNTKIWDQAVTKKMARKSLLIALSEKARAEQLIILDSLELQEPKTKQVSVLLGKLAIKLSGLSKAKTLIILPKADKKIFLAARNIPGVETIEARNINALKILSFKYLLFPKETLAELKNMFSKKQ